MPQEENHSPADQQRVTRRRRPAARRQHRINKLIKAAFALVAGLLGIVLVFYVFHQLAVQEFVPGKDVYLRDVYVLIDQTKSMNETQLQEVKAVIKNEVLGSLGLGDRAFCYRISSDFDEIKDRVFAGSRDLPKVPDNLIGTAVKQLSDELKSELVSRWKVFEAERQAWNQQLAELAPAEGNFSDYLAMLKSIGRRIKDDPSLAAEQWLIVAGDLEHDTPDATLESYPTSKSEKWQFSGVEVYLVYPGGTHKEEEQERIEAGWRKYFANRGNKHINIVSFDQFIGDFPSSAVPRPEELTPSEE